MRQAWNKGRPFSEKSKQRMREAKLRLWQDPAYRAKCIASHLGKVMSPETRVRMSLAHKGKIRSVEHGLKLSMALKRYFKNNPEAHPQLGMKREKSCKWKGGRFQKPDGYVFIYCPDHPRHDGRGYVAEHRLIVERALNRYLKPLELVHHINEDPSDNRNSNLLVGLRSYHSWLHHEMDRRKTWANEATI